MSDDNNVVRLTVSIQQEQANTIQQFAKDSGVGNVSAALRLIITEWANNRKAKTGCPVSGCEAQA
jgi:hypothetical protein